MKVFFSMSFRGDVAVGYKIYSIIKNLGYTHTYGSFASEIPKEFYQWSNKRRLNHFKRFFLVIYEKQIWQYLRVQSRVSPSVK